MKKWTNLISALIVIALLIWAGSRFSTVMARMVGFFDAALDGGATQFIDGELDFTPTLPPQDFALTDQDYDDMDVPADAEEDVRP